MSQIFKKADLDLTQDVSILFLWNKVGLINIIFYFGLNSSVSCVCISLLSSFFLINKESESFEKKNWNSKMYT